MAKYLEIIPRPQKMPVFLSYTNHSKGGQIICPCHPNTGIGLFSVGSVLSQMTLMCTYGGAECGEPQGMTSRKCSSMSVDFLCDF